VAHSTQQMEALREHFEPIIASAEDEYNEEFCTDTRIKIVKLTDVESSKPLLLELNLLKLLLKFFKLCKQFKPNKHLKPNTNAILEAIKVQNQPSSINWTPLIQAVATAIPAMVGVPSGPASAPISAPTPHKA